MAPLKERKRPYWRNPWIPLNHDYGRFRVKNIHQDRKTFTKLIWFMSLRLKWLQNFVICEICWRERSPVYPTKQLAVRADKAGLHSLLTRYGSKIIKIKLQRSLVPDPENIMSTKFASNYSALRDMMQEIVPPNKHQQDCPFSLLQKLHCSHRSTCHVRVHCFSLA